VPGELDGQCNRWEPAGSPDPVRGMTDPAAGDWFPAMALELAKNAKPQL
jgi:endoglucanase